MSAVQPIPVGIQLSIQIGKRMRHTDYKGTRVTGVVRALDVDQERGLMISIILDEPLIIPAEPKYGLTETRIYQMCVPAHELAEFDERDELIAELTASMQAVIAISDRKHDAWDRAKAAIAKATGAAA